MPAPDDDIYKVRLSGTPLDDPESMEASAELWRVIGLSACTWARLEQHIDMVLIHLNQPKHSEKLHDPDHPIGFKRKIKLLKRWFNQHPALAEHRASLRQITTKMLALSKTRNAFLHSILDSYDPSTKTAVFRAVRAMSPTTYQAGKYVGTLETFLQFAGETHAAHLRFALISTAARCARTAPNTLTAYSVSKSAPGPLTPTPAAHTRSAGETRPAPHGDRASWRDSETNPRRARSSRAPAAAAAPAAQCRSRRGRA